MASIAILIAIIENDATWRFLAWRLAEAWATAAGAPTGTYYYYYY